MGLGDIMAGHINELFNSNSSMSNKRLRICRVCPIYFKSSILGEICNSKLYINPESGDVSTNPQDGYVRGCGCRLQAKTRLANARCVAKKW